MDPSAQYAVIASRAAMEDAGSPELDPLRLGVAIGTGIGGVWTLLDSSDPGLPQSGNLRFLVTGNRLELFVDGASVLVRARPSTRQ